MNKSKLKIIFFIVFSIIAGCSSTTQMSSYTPLGGGESWSVNVVEKTSFKKLMSEYICVINDSAVISESFPSTGGKAFIKKGTYRGKKVVMNGYKISESSTDKDGKTFYRNTYEIRILIENILVDKFEF